MSTVTVEGGVSATIRWGAWFDDQDLPLSFPPGWEVTVCEPRDAADIGDDGVAESFARPFGAPRLRELAKGRTSPCIVIDDLSRPTLGSRLIPAVLAELEAAGIAAEDVLVLAGVANHRPMTREDLIKKIGPDVLSRCRVRNHFSWSGCVPVGVTSEGTPIEVNADYLACDLRILVGSIIPHGAAGFSGGAKLLMPGIASADSATAFHRGSALRGGYALDEPPARLEAEEAGRLAGVDYIVNSVPTSRLGIAGVVVGDMVAAHRAGVAIARRVFATRTPVDRDICVLSLYPKDSEFLQHVTAFAPYKTATAPIVAEGGTVVVALAGSEGIGFHSLFGPGMRLGSTRATRVRGRDLVFFTPGIERGELSDAARAETPLFATWEQTRRWLEHKHGAAASVAVFPCATMQLAEEVC